MITLTKSTNTYGGGSYFRTVPGSNFYNHRDIYDAIRIGEDTEFFNCNEFRALVSIIRSVEMNNEGKTGRTINRHIKGDTDLMNRIIRGGGFCEYIEELENGQNHDG